MIGVDPGEFEVLEGVRMLLVGSLILGTFGAFLMGLCSLVLDPHFDAFPQGLPGTSGLSRADHVLADGEKAVAVSPLSVGQQGQVVGLLHHLGQEGNCLGKERLSSLPTGEFPDEPRGAFHQDDGPAFRRFGRGVLIDLGVKFISFNELAQELMAQRIEEQGLLESSQAFQPVIHGILGNLERTTYCIDPHPIVQSVQDLSDLAQRSSQTLQEGVLGLREAISAVRTAKDAARLTCLHLVFSLLLQSFVSTDRTT